MHWYKFELSESKDILICKANRKSEVATLFKTSPRFYGCVDREKIPLLRNDPHVTVFNSVSRLRTVLSEVAPGLLRLEEFQYARDNAAVQC